LNRRRIADGEVRKTDGGRQNDYWQGSICYCPIIVDIVYNLIKKKEAAPAGGKPAEALAKAGPAGEKV